MEIVLKIFTTSYKNPAKDTANIALSPPIRQRSFTRKHNGVFTPTAIIISKELAFLYGKAFPIQTGISMFPPQVFRLKNLPGECPQI